MPEVVREVEVKNENGIHVRPSSQIAALARNYQSTLTIKNGAEEADARSVIGLLQLQACQGTRLVIKASGQDAEAAVTALIQLFEERFGFEA